jgi:protein-S-isoprenylcysteine O-methyltransferase Ste14
LGSKLHRLRQTAVGVVNVAKIRATLILSGSHITENLFMLTMLRHLLAILLLPFMVVVVVPSWLRSTFLASDSHWADGAPIAWLSRLAGAALLIAGCVLFSWCVSLFARIGQGTLAPWDPTRNMVAVGPYRFVRNPMITSVALMLTGQAFFWGSWVTAMWAGIFVLINHVYFLLLEEPGLEQRFGEPYNIYKANVPRWLPRIKPRSDR